MNTFENSTKKPFFLKALLFAIYMNKKIKTECSYIKN